MAFYPFTPALRLVNSSGAVIAGPLKLYLPDSETYGINLTRTGPPVYAEESLGPWLNVQYQERKLFLGYRVRVDLSFSLVRADGFSGFANLAAYHAGSNVGFVPGAGQYAALQLNMFFLTSSVWRGMLVKTAWEPRPAVGKQRVGYELDMSLEARDLIAAPGDWSAGTW